MPAAPSSPTAEDLEWVSRLASGQSNWDEDQSGGGGGVATSSPQQRGVPSSSRLQVVVRVRPPLPRELESGVSSSSSFMNVCHISPDDPSMITLCDAVETMDGRGAVYARQSFQYDRVFGPETEQRRLYEECAMPVVASVLNGFNGTLIAYGQTGTGKTYTMEGFTSDAAERRGIIPRAMEDIFRQMSVRRAKDSTGTFSIRASYLQIYNEVMYDLLSDEMPMPSTSRSTGRGTFSPTSPVSSRPKLAVRHTPRDGVYVEGLSQWQVLTEDDVYTLIERGTAMRATSTTRMSEVSSRSHAVFTVVVELHSSQSGQEERRVGKLCIVDLAGSEKVKHTGVTGKQLEETKRINRSLHELGNVISALAQHSSGTPRSHIPFRNSVLTSVLKDSLGGNCLTTLIACLTPSLDSYAESLSTLSFASRARSVTSHVTPNIGFTSVVEADRSAVGMLESLVAARSRELEKVVRDRDEEVTRRQELEAQVHHLRAQNHHHLLRLQRVEAQLASSQRQAAAAVVSPRSERGHSAVAVADEEGEASDRFQAESYKKLLLKQRDVMLTLTAKLNERDEIIMDLEEQLEAYAEDRQQGLSTEAAEKHAGLETAVKDARETLSHLTAVNLRLQNDIRLVALERTFHRFQCSQFRKILSERPWETVEAKEEVQRHLERCSKELVGVLQSSQRAMTTSLLQDHSERWKTSKKIEALKHQLLELLRGTPTPSSEAVLALNRELEAAAMSVLPPVEGGEAYLAPGATDEGSLLPSLLKDSEEKWKDMFDAQESSRLPHNGNRGDGAAAAQQLTRMEERLEDYRRDRCALSNILSNKMLKRVDEVDRLMKLSDKGDATGASKEGDTAAASDALRTLRRIIESTLEALQEDEEDDEVSSRVSE